jgi:hypothetical protein
MWEPASALAWERHSLSATRAPTVRADGVGGGPVDALGETAGEAPALGDAPADGDGSADGITSGSGPILRAGTIFPMRGRSAWGPPKGAFELGAAMTSAATAATAATPSAASGATSVRLRAGRSPVFCGERAYATLGRQDDSSAARLAHGALE